MIIHVIFYEKFDNDNNDNDNDNNKRSSQKRRAELALKKETGGAYSFDSRLFLENFVALIDLITE